MEDHANRPSFFKMFLTALDILAFPAFILFLSGDWAWIEGWIFGLWFTALSATIIIYLYLHDPGLLAERYKKPGTGNQKSWDRYVSYGILIGFLIWIFIIPLDARRFGWSPGFPLAVKIIAGIGLLVSFFLIYRSHTDNTFLSPLVRIQFDRKHRVITTGVYAFVRHPLYLGAILMLVSGPVMLGSLYGVFAGVLLSLILAGRAIGEENMLMEELEGYADYRKKVKYRLIPFVW